MARSAHRRTRLVGAPRLAFAPATRPNERWSIDFVGDATASGRRLRVFAAVDDFSRRRVALVGGSFTRSVVGALLDVGARESGLPTTTVGDHGTEFTSKAMDRRAFERVAPLHFIRPGKPIEYGYAANSDAKLRDECPDTNSFPTVEEAKAGSRRGPSTTTTRGRTARSAAWHRWSSSGPTPKSRHDSWVGTESRP